jgi:hypothetical protein
MFPSIPSVPVWPWWTYLAITIVWLFILGFWLACLLGIVRLCVQALTGAWRAMVYEGSRYFYTTPDRGIAASLQDLTRLFTGKPACEAWSKGIAGV